MFSLRPTVLLSLVLGLITSTATASSNRKTEPSCKDCTARFDECVRACKPGSLWTCEHDCNGQVAKNNTFCRDSCDMGGPESACGDI